MTITPSHVKEIVDEFNKKQSLKDGLGRIVKIIRRITDIEAVAIRLYAKGDYPYFVYDGFKEAFIHHENSLCVKDEEGHYLMEDDGKGYLLECMCGNVIRGRINPEMDFFTSNGSFVSNHTTALLATTTEEDRQAHTRNYCNSCGFETVALIPIKIGSATIGLIQLNDLRKNRLSAERLEFLELLGIALGSLLKDEARFAEWMSDNRAERKPVFLTICAQCKRVLIHAEWIPIEMVLRQLENVRAQDIAFSHGICPKCEKEMYGEYSLPDESDEDQE